MRDSAPSLLPESIPYWNAFQTLSGTRLCIDGDAQPITVAETLAYVRLVGIDDEDEQDDTFGIVQALDREYLSDHRKKRADAKRKAQQDETEMARRNRPRH